MKEDIMEVLMNPTHQRILQVLLAKGTGTTAVIREELSDIPPASLYRHVKRLLDAGLIEELWRRHIVWWRTLLGIFPMIRWRAL